MQNKEKNIIQSFSFCSTDCNNYDYTYWRNDDFFYNYNKEFLSWGADNLYPQKLIELYDKSSLHQALTKSIATLIKGEDVVESEGIFNPYIENVNKKESLLEVIEKVSFDFKLFGGFALNIIKNKYNKEKTAEIYHIPLQNLRPKVVDNKIVGWYYSINLTKNRNKKIFIEDYYNNEDALSSILFVKNYSPSNNPHLPKSDYIGAIKEIQTEAAISDFRLNLINNGMTGAMHVAFNNGTPTSEEISKIRQKITSELSGSENAGKLLITFSDSKESGVDIKPIASPDSDKSFVIIYEQVQNAIIIGHRIPDPALIGLLIPGKLGVGTDLETSYEMLMTMVINPYQKIIEKTFSKLFQKNGIDSNIKIVELKPFQTKNKTTE
jgi:hypothetical protein